MHKYYLVDEIHNNGYCFNNIAEIEEAAETLGLKFEDLHIYDTVMLSLHIDAKDIVDNEIEGGEFFELFTSDEINKSKMDELQTFLNEWCKDINTYSYIKNNLLDINKKGIFK